MQTDVLLELLESEAERSSEQAAQLLDCVSALAFHLVCRWQDSAALASAIHGGQAVMSHDAAISQSAAEEAAVQSLSRCISVLARLSASAFPTTEGGGARPQPTAAQIAAVLAENATDIAAQQAVWWQLYLEAAAAAGMDHHAMQANISAAEQQRVPLGLPFRSDVVDKVRAFKSSEIRYDVPTCRPAYVNHCQRHRSLFTGSSVACCHACQRGLGRREHNLRHDLR